MSLFFQPSRSPLPAVLQQATPIEELNHKKTEDLLSGKKPFTCIVRASGTINKFFLSFVQPGYEVEHLFFFYTRAFWCYDNAVLEKLPTFESLIQKVMNCSLYECNIINL